MGSRKHFKIGQGKKRKKLAVFMEEYTEGTTSITTHTFSCLYQSIKLRVYCIFAISLADKIQILATKKKKKGSKFG